MQEGRITPRSTPLRRRLYLLAAAAIVPLALMWSTVALTVMVAWPPTRIWPSNTLAKAQPDCPFSAVTLAEAVMPPSTGWPSPSTLGLAPSTALANEPPLVTEALIASPCQPAALSAKEGFSSADEAPALSGTQSTYVGR